MNQFSKLFLLFISIILYSCANGLNKPYQKIKIHSAELYSINNQVVKKNNSDTFSIIRSKKSFQINVFVNDSLQILEIKSKITPVHYLNTIPLAIGIPVLLIGINDGDFRTNLYGALFTGIGVSSFMIDNKTGKKYSYPKNIHIYSEKGKAYYFPFDKKILNQKNIIKVSPLRILENNYQSLELAFERKINNQLSFQTSYAKMIDLGEKIGTDKSGLKGEKLGFELKYFLKETAPFGTYISLEHNRIFQYFNDIPEFSKAIRDTTYNSQSNYYRDSILIKRYVKTIALKLGYQYIRNNFCFDISAGLGVKNINIKHFGRINEADYLIIPRFPYSNQIEKRNINYNRFFIPINIRFGFSF